MFRPCRVTCFQRSQAGFGLVSGGRTGPQGGPVEDLLRDEAKHLFVYCDSSLHLVPILVRRQSWPLRPLPVPQLPQIQVSNDLPSVQRLLSIR